MRYKATKYRQQGLSLVELMIALAISSMVTVGLVQMFEANQNISKLLQGQSSLAESGRFAAEMIARSVRKAGYRGCNSKRPLEVTINTVPYEFDLEQGLLGYEAAGASWTPTFDSTLMPTTQGTTDVNVFSPGTEQYTGLDLDAVRPGSDIITVWFASSTEFSVDTAARPMLQGTLPVLLTATPAQIASEIGVNHLTFINDCSTEDMFVVTGISTTGGNADLQHVANVGEGAALNFSPDLGTGSGYQDGAVVMAIKSHTFYIGTSASVNQFGDPIYSLYRKEGLLAPVELVEGIENIQILYGLDTQGEVLVPSTYVNASGITDYRDVVSVRIQITVNSIDDVGSNSIDAITSAADGLSRRTLTQTVRLRNRLKKE